MSKRITQNVVCLGAVLICTFGGNLRAESNKIGAKSNVSKSEVIEKISVVLTGLLPSGDELNRIENGSLKVEDYVEGLRTKAELQTKLTNYWMSVLKINDKFNPSAIVTSPAIPAIPATPATAKSAAIVARPAVAAKTLATLPYRMDFANSKVIDILKVGQLPEYNTFRNRQMCASERVVRIVPVGIFRLDARIKLEKEACAANPDSVKAAACSNSLATYEATGRPAQLASLDAAECACGQEVAINPFWNPSVSIKACPDAIDKCGPNLKLCQLFDTRLNPSLANFKSNTYNSHSSYGTDVIENLTIEPALQIAKNVLNKMDFRLVLTDNATYLNGATAHYLDNFGENLPKNGPPNSYKSLNGTSTLTAIANPVIRTYTRINRGAAHAGILTTPMFHQVTNGYRAKANRIYEGFLCKRFVVSASLPPSPSTVSDLAVREPCAQCHKLLEPMGSFFYRWAKDGVNYLYDPAATARGQFGGSIGVDALGLGQAVSTQPDFDKCAVQRAFEFVMGREISAKESLAMLPELLATYQAANRQVWPVIKALVVASNFTGDFK